MSDYDVCIIGSGAGGGSVAYSLAAAGYRVLVLEKGPRYARTEFLKDEVIQQRRWHLRPSRRVEPVLRSWWKGQGTYWPASETGEFWNGNLVGGSSELMSGFFMRLKPRDFRLRSELGEIEGATLADWPIDYDELEPWYAQAEQLVGVSGRVRADLPPEMADKRSTPDFPQPPTDEHPFAGLLDTTCDKLGLHAIPLPRAVLSRTDGSAYPDRRACDYNGYCGSYGCYQGAKGSAGAAFIPRAEATGRCTVMARAAVTRLETDDTGKRVVRAHYRDEAGVEHEVEAAVFVVACQAVESARLLLKSRSERHPNGLANANGQVGRNLVSSAFGSGWGEFPYAGHPEVVGTTEPFVNRIIQDYAAGGPGHALGGTLNFLLMHPNPINAAVSQSMWDRTSAPTDRKHFEKIPVWGEALKQRLAHYFLEVEHLRFEVFAEWLPNPDCFVSLAKETRDAYGEQVAHVHVRSHPKSIEAAGWLRGRGKAVLDAMGAQEVRTLDKYGTPSTNLLAGTCRFGDDPKSSVLDRSCKAHGVDNLYVADGSFMPTGGTVPFTFTIYANALRVGSIIASRLKAGEHK